MCDNLDRAKRKCMGAGLYYFWDGDDIFSTSPCHCDNLCRNTSHNLQEIKRMRVRYVIFSKCKWILSKKQHFLPKKGQPDFDPLNFLWQPSYMWRQETSRALLCFRAFSSNALHHYNYYQHHVIMFPWRKVECFMNSLYSSPSILLSSIYPFPLSLSPFLFSQ